MGRHEEASRKNIDSSSTVTSNSCPREPALLPDDVIAVTACTGILLDSSMACALDHHGPTTRPQSYTYSAHTECSEAEGRRTGRS